MKHNGIFIISLCVIVLMLAVSSVSASEDDTNETSIMETPADDAVLSTDVGGGTFTNLRQAMYSSNNISLTGHITRVAGESEIMIYSGQNIEINGNGNIISADFLGRSFTILPGGQLTLKNVQLINGKLPESLSSDFDGGAILNMGTLTAINCQFISNYARDGGAIATDLGAFTEISGTTFRENHVWQDGGAISNRGGSTLVINGKNTFDTNYAYYDGGAAIPIDEGKGGAILNAFDNAKMYMSGENTFVNNYCKADGGAIFNHQAYANITGTNTFKNNKARTGTVAKGGAINNENGTFYLGGQNTFESNSAYRGGAIDNSLYGSVFTMSGNNRFVNNKAGMGGAISNEQARNFIIYGSNTFESNSANYKSQVGGSPDIGGAIYTFRSGFNIDASCVFNSNSATGSGGVIYFAESSGAIKGHNSFNSNSAPIGGALLLIDSNRIDLAGENVFSSNTASVSGGAIRASNVKEVIISNHNYFSNNRAGDSGGAIYVQNCALNVQGTLFEANSAIYGGAVYLLGSAFLANYDIFKNNYASKTGSDIESYQSSIVNLEFNYWNSQGKVSQNNIHNYEVSRISNWVIIDLTIPSQIEINSPVEVLRFKTNNGAGLGGQLPMYGVSVTPNFNPSNVIITENVGKSTYVGGPGQINVNAASSNYGASRVVNAVEGKVQTSLSGNNLLFTSPNQSGNYVVTLTDAKGNKLSGKTVSITVDSRRNDRVTDGQGRATLVINNLANGYHEISVSFAGESKYYASSTTNGVICIYSDQSGTNLVGRNVEMYYKDGSRYEVTLTDASGRAMASKDVKFYISGSIYTRTTDANGKASIAINLNSGTYEILACYPGTGNNDFSYVKNNITIKPTISGQDIVKYYKNATQYYATFLDKNGNPLKNTAVSFNINGVFYTRNTNDQGVARMNINLNPGKYIITAQNPVNGEMYSNTVTVLGVLSGKDLTKYFRNASQYSMQVLGGDGKPIGAGVKVKFNINGVFYERVTDESGVARMNINLNPGTYTITGEYNGLMHSNTIKVLPVLYANDITMRYKDGTRFKVKLVDGQGKAFTNQTVQFNVNGVFYDRITDSEGYASLAINLMPGQYIITSAYEYARLSNTITINS